MGINSFVKLKVLALLILMVFAYSCTKEVTTPPQKELEDLKISAQNESIKTFAKIVAQGIENVEFRKFLKKEALKQFDGEFNVLYQFVKDNKIAEKTVNDFLFSSSKSNDSDINLILQNVPNIQIAIPVNIDNWNVENYIPYVLSLPVDFDDSKELELVAFRNDGSSITLNSKTPPDFPVIVVSKSQRVDEKLKLKVNEDNIILDPKDRELAVETYKNLNFKIKKSIGKETQSFVRIESEDFIDSLYNTMQKYDIPNNQDFINHFEEQIINPKNTIPIPTLTIEYPSTSYINTLSWTHVDVASSYKIYRRDEQTTYQEIATVLSTPTFPVNIYQDITTTAGTYYTYHVRAVDNQGYHSLPSNDVKIWSSARWQGGKERVISMVIPSDLTWELESWVLGPHLELVIDVHQANNQTISGNKWNLLNKSIYRDNLGNWLFPLEKYAITDWNLSRGNAYYTINVTEEDITGTWNFKTQLGYDKNILGVVTKSVLNYDCTYTNGNDDGGHFHVSWYSNPRNINFKTTKGILFQIRFEHEQAPCPYGGSYGQWGSEVVCFVVAPNYPSEVSIINNWWYYSPYNGTCPLGGELDQYGCKYKLIPTEIRPYAKIEYFKRFGYYPAGF
jgi:hypothetical protein